MYWPLSNELERFDDRAQLEGLSGVQDVPAGGGETFAAALDQVLNEERTDSHLRAWRPHLQDRTRAIMSVGGDPQLAQVYELKGVGWMSQIGQMVESLGEDVARTQVSGPQDVDAYLQQRALERAFPDTVLSDQILQATITQELAEKRNKNQAIQARGGAVANFLGAGAGLVTDPLILMTLPAGPGAQVGRGVFVNAARGFAFEGAVAFAVEVPVQLEVARFKHEIDSPWTYKDAAYNVLAATLGAGLIRGTGSVTVDLAQDALKKYRAGRGVPRTAETDAAADILQRYIEIESDSPLLALQRNIAAEDQIPGVEFFFPHAEAHVKARAQAEAGDAVDVAEIVRPHETLNPVDQAAGQFTLDNVTVFQPGELTVDARRFQFKEGGNAQGVTSSLSGVTRFDPALAGQVLAWEDAAGTRYIVDGHQRVGLQGRAAAAGQDPTQLGLPGFVLRESDGVSAEDAMRIGAVRNLTASTGSALDAAKVLRGIGPAGELMLPPLPPNSALLRQGRFIARLEDESFNAVVNEIVPGRQAAIVGELIQGEAQQLATLNALSRLKPANEVQARAMVEQIRTAGFEVKTTEDLFGEQLLADTLVRERAQVVDAALKAARQDRTTFTRLVSRGTEIEAAGANRLDQAANQRRALESGQAIESITRLANQKGEVSDALAEAARQVKGGAQPAAAAKSVLEALERAGPLSDTGGRQADAIRLAADNEPEPKANIAAREELDPEGAPINPVDRNLDPQGRAEQLHELGRENDALVKPVLAELDRALGTTSKTSFKRIETILDKVTRPSVLAKRPWMQVENIRDSYRFKSVIEPGVDLAAIDEAVTTLLAQIPGTTVIKADTSMLFEPKQWGWRAAVYDLQMPNGQTVEWYIPIRELEDAKKAGGHALFERWRDEDVTAISKEQRVQMVQDIEASNKLYDDAWQAALARMDQDETAARAAFESADASSASSLVNDSARSSPVMGVLPELDQTSFSSTATKPSEPSTTTVPVSRSLDTESSAMVGSSASGDIVSRDLQLIQARGVPDEGGATGYVPDDVYNDAIAQFELLEADSGGLLELSRLSVDEAGETGVEIVSARRAIDELDGIEDAVRDIDACARGAA